MWISKYPPFHKKNEKNLIKIFNNFINKIILNKKNNYYKIIFFLFCLMYIIQSFYWIA